MAYEIARKIVSGRKAVSSAGSAEQITTDNIQCFLVLISADLGNSNPVVVGDANVVAANDSQQGVVLTPGNPPLAFQVRDVSQIYVDVQTNNDAVCFVYFAV
jgi:hypothetical protein